MEEKERYEETDIKTINFINIYDNEKGTLKFLSTKAVCDLLNQCDKRIKELEQGLKTREVHINILEERNKVLLKLIGKLYK